MRHRVRGKRIATDESHQNAMMRTMAGQFITNGYLTSTHSRVKVLQPLVEELVTLGKRGDIHARRQAMALIGDKSIVHELFATIAPRYQDRQGGYTRVLKIGFRKGDAAPVSRIELV